MRITLLQNLIDDAIAAVEDETYDALDGSHMSWSPMLIDERARLEINKLLDQALMKALDIQKRAAKRLSASGDEGISYSVSILGYPSIGGIKKVNPPKVDIKKEGERTRTVKNSSGAKRTKETSQKSKGKRRSKRR